MRHARTRHKLSRDSAHRKALLRNLSKQLIEHERRDVGNMTLRFMVRPGSDY